MTKLFAQAALGYNPVVALVDTRRGIVQAVVGPAARRPKTDLSKTPLFSSMTRSQSGAWTGVTAIDGVERLHAFHRVAGRDMVVLVAANLAEVMAPADNLAAGAHALAFVATALVMSIGGLVLWELYTIRGQRRRQRIFDRNRGELERLRIEEAGNIARAQLNAVRLQVVLDGITDGIALFDSSLRLVQWNHPFLRGIGIELRKDMPLDALLREQAAKGLFGSTTMSRLKSRAEPAFCAPATPRAAAARTRPRDADPARIAGRGGRIYSAPERDRHLGTGPAPDAFDGNRSARRTRSDRLPPIEW